MRLTVQRKQQASSTVRRSATPAYAGPGAVAQRSDIRTIMRQGAQPMVYPKGCTLTRAEVTPNRSITHPWMVSLSYTLNTPGRSYYEFYLTKQSECSKTGKPSGYLLGGNTLGGVVVGSEDFTATNKAVNDYPYAIMVNDNTPSERSCIKWTK